MTEKEVMEMFENGDAVGVYTNILLMEAHGRTYFSFDGNEWEETESELIKKQF